MLVRRLMRIDSELPVLGHGGFVPDKGCVTLKEVEADSLEEAFGVKVERIKNLDNEVAVWEVYYEAKTGPDVIHSNYFREIVT